MILPRTLGIELVRGCNFRCKMCPVTANNPQIEYMTLDLLKEIADKCKDLASIANVWLFNFGEPLLHPNFRECLELLYQYEVFQRANVIVHTNASMLLDDRASAILDVPLINKLVFSFDGYGDKKSFELLRGKHYLQVINNISQFSVIAKQRRPELQLATCTILPQMGEVAELDYKTPEEAKALLEAVFSPMGVAVETREMHNYSGNDRLEIKGQRKHALFGDAAL